MVSPILSCLFDDAYGAEVCSIHKQKNDDSVFRTQEEKILASFDGINYYWLKIFF